MKVQWQPHSAARKGKGTECGAVEREACSLLLCKPVLSAQNIVYKDQLVAFESGPNVGLSFSGQGILNMWFLSKAITDTLGN